MQFLLDNLAAVMIGGALLLIMALVQQRGQQGAIEATLHDNAKAKAQSLHEVLMRDLQNMAGGDHDNDGKLEVCSLSKLPSGNTNSFVFPTVVNTGASSETRYVRYTLTETGETVMVKGASQPLYRIEREERVPPSGSWKEAGGGLSSITQFKVALYPADANSMLASNGTFEEQERAGNCENINLRRVGVRFRVAHAPVRGAEGNLSQSNLNEVRYSETIRPPYLPAADPENFGPSGS